MSRFHSYVNSAKEILQQYTGREPFAIFIKEFFRQHKKYGSSDRKQISQLCYCYFRLGKAAPPNHTQTEGLNEKTKQIEERILAGLFLCSNEPNEILQHFKPQWNEKIHKPVEEKCSMYNDQFSIFNAFPWEEELSRGVDYEAFCYSIFIQPDLFIRLRPGKAELVKKKLQESGIDFKVINDICLALHNTTKINKVIELDKDAVVQDYNSQQIGNFLQLQTPNSKLQSYKVWDCCTGSGGKSILAYDILPDIDLTVSDIRDSILSSLKKRFEIAGIKKYKCFIADLTTYDSRLMTKDFGLIICDVPCTGSGTWGRTPEQLFYFDEQKILYYSLLQRQIACNAISHLKPGGYFLYITCSVFKKENEEVVEFLTGKFNLQLMKMVLLKGYDKKADSLFVALLQK